MLDGQLSRAFQIVAVLGLDCATSAQLKIIMMEQSNKKCVLMVNVKTTFLLNYSYKTNRSFKRTVATHLSRCSTYTVGDFEGFT